MAANFWGSSQFKLLLDKATLRCTNGDDRAKGLTDEEITKLKGYFFNLLCELARHAKLRQRVVATAMTYFRRFYVTSSFCRHDPRIVAPGCLYVASKCEESIIAAKHLVLYMKKLQHTPPWPYDVQQLLDTEMVILEELDYNLILFDPYGPLQQYLAAPALLDVAKHAWGALNDLYRTDLCLVYPPYLLALGCIAFAALVAGKDISEWLERLEVDMNLVYDVALELNLMYTEFTGVMTTDECGALLDRNRS